VDEKLKQLTQELGQAIDQAINESARVKDLTEQLRAAGYETILMVEATICFARRVMTLSGEMKDLKELKELNDDVQDNLSQLMTGDDLQFLKKLNISIEDMDEPGEEQ
jgi:hypothetical protein